LPVLLGWITEVLQHLPDGLDRFGVPHTTLVLGKVLAIMCGGCSAALNLTSPQWPVMIVGGCLAAA
jgi:hypothetical protein